MRLFQEERGQDVSEYSLLIAFLLLISLCLFLDNVRDVAAIWEAANNLLMRGGGNTVTGH